MCKYEEIEGLATLEWQDDFGKPTMPYTMRWNESTWKRGRKVFPCRILKTEKPILLILMEAMLKQLLILQHANILS